MSPQKRFFLGGGGALMAVLVSLLAIDIAAVIDDEANLTTGNIVGFAIRYLILFLVGGVVAYLHEDEKISFKLFELGVAAPALITSLITAQGVGAGMLQNGVPPTAHNSISIVSSAYAESTIDSSKEIVLAGGFFTDIYDGVTGKVYRDIPTRAKKRPNDRMSREEDANVELERTRAEMEDLRREIQDLEQERGDLIRERPTHVEPLVPD